MSIPIPAIEGLTIGSIIPDPIMQTLREIKSHEQNISNATADLNDLIALKRSLTTLDLELRSIGVVQIAVEDQNLAANGSSINSIEERVKEVEQKIMEAANNLSEVQITAQARICQLKRNLREQNPQSVNIADLRNTKIISKPLYYNSLKMDGRYFSSAANSDYNKIKDFIRRTVSDFPTETNANKLADTIIERIKTHEDTFATEGTIIIAATCTHLYASICDSLKIDINKAIAAWNHLHTEDKINKEKIINQNLFETEEDRCLEVITGANYGSSFIGIIHILKNNGPAINLTDLNTNINFTTVEKLLKNKKINSHINLVVNGNIPKFNESDEEGIFDVNNLMGTFNSFIKNTRESKANNGIPISLYTTKVSIHEIVIESVKLKFRVKN